MFVFFDIAAVHCIYKNVHLKLYHLFSESPVYVCVLPALKISNTLMDFIWFLE